MSAKIYAADFKVWATAYIRADSPKEAREKAQALATDYFEFDRMQSVEGVPLLGLAFNDPELPDVSIAPTMSIDATDIRNLRADDFEERS